ncbi:MAG: helix-turn-helix transcriptional regulator [Peptoniphilus sp.]|uniref:helix-turn-helix domain-containing protein n=1 Tax=Peptoniphilus sp. TaxID=1971214 RepID=UPI0025F67C4B|nr:helix-turn-helix transcriptional regulator [Peptoniphilus sp.]MCI5643678.1 helix-turn-helix transcriptional regulator [Peptoniphilus sp.]
MMKFSYKKLFKKLIDLEMKSTELMDEAQISKSTFYKIKNGQNVTTDVLLRICNTLDCDISDIVECEKTSTENH